MFSSATPAARAAGSAASPWARYQATSSARVSRSGRCFQPSSCSALAEVTASRACIIRTAARVTSVSPPVSFAQLEVARRPSTPRPACCNETAMKVQAGTFGSLALFVGAAVLEVLGDALIRKGMRGSGLVLIGVGFAVLGTYGVVVNLLDLDFSRLLGAYVGIFAV